MPLSKHAQAGAGLGSSWGIRVVQKEWPALSFLIAKIFHDIPQWVHACVNAVMHAYLCVCVWAADTLYGSLLYLLESESLTDPGAQWFRQIDDQQVPEPTDSFISLLPSPVMRTRFVLYVPQCWEQDSGPHTCEAASSHRVVLLAFRSWFKEVKVMICLWIHTAVIPASNIFDDIQ